MLNSNSNISDSFTRNVVIGSGYDLETMSEDQKNQVSSKVVSVYLEFVDKAFLDLADSNLVVQWTEFKNAGLDGSYLNTNKFLQLKIQEYTKLFFEMQK